MKNYYNILGVKKSSSDGEIKKAFRKKALEYHPDRNKDNPKAEDKFKEVNEAYAVLSDKKKRGQYDNFGAEGFRQRYTQDDIFRGFDPSEVFQGFGGGGGSSDFMRSVEDLFGGPFGGQRPDPRRPQKGPSMEHELTITFREAALGTEKSFILQRNGSQEETSVKIPAGISDGKKLRLAGKGHPAPHGGKPGDLYFKIRVLSDPVFKREKDDVIIERDIKLTDALLGTTIEVPTLEGEKQVKVPAGSSGSTKLRLKGLGIKHVKGSGKGDQIVQIQVTYPKKLNDEQKDMIQKLKDSGL